MPSRYAEYKKRRLIRLQQRIQYQDLEIQKLQDEVRKLYYENQELKSQVHYYESRPKR